MDILYIGLAIAFFVASWWFVRVCASLEPRQEDRK